MRPGAWGRPAQCDPVLPGADAIRLDILTMTILSDKMQIIVYFLRSKLNWVVFTLCCSVCVAVFEGINVAAIFPIVQSVISPGETTQAYGPVIKTVNSILSFSPIDDVFISSCFFLAVATAFKSFFSLCYTYCSNKLSQLARKEIQDLIYEKTIDSDMLSLQDQKQGTLLYRLLTAPVNVGTTLKLIPDIVYQAIRILALLVLLVSISWKASVFIIGIGIVFGFIVKVMSRQSYRFGKEVTTALSEQTIIANESISGIRQIKIYGAENQWRGKFASKVHDYYHYKLKSQLLNASPMILLEPIIILVIVIIGIQVRLAYADRFTDILPVFSVYAFAIIRINPSLSTIGQLRMLVMNVFPDLEICHKAMKSQTRFIDDGDRVVDAFKTGIEFINIGFSYPERDLLFEDLTFSIRKGQTTAFVGASGIGKSTVMDLLIRLYDPNTGVIRVDGIDLKDIRIASWREKIGYVSQESFVFHATIEENITFGLKRYSTESVVEAAKAAYAHEFISQFPKGYDTVVGDRGMKLSGGQKQRIAIARAIIRKPDLIIFDEATSALDNISEKQVQKAIDTISEEYTVILIAHRLSTIQGADNILILSDRRIVEQGEHADLLKRKGAYWRLYNKSLSEADTMMI